MGSDSHERREAIGSVNLRDFDEAKSSGIQRDGAGRDRMLEMS
jgi:hypothetical protein